MPTVSYPLDKTGLAVTNKVVNEPHTLTEINANAYRILIPDFAPFYQDNFVAVVKDANGVETTLRRDLDYTFTLPYASFIRAIGKMVYGAIAISNSDIQGSVYLTYQTLGGDEVASVSVVREMLYQITYNPRTASWDVIANKPQQFAPETHMQEIDTLYGAQELIKSIEDVSAAILNGSSGGGSGSVVAHLIDHDNPHQTTKAQVGLGDVVNLPVATVQDIADKVPAEKYILLKQALELFQQTGSIPTASDLEVTNHASVNKFVYLRQVLNLLSSMTANDQDVIAANPTDKFLLLSQALTLFTNYRPPTPTAQEVHDFTPVDKYLLLSQAVAMFQAYAPPTATSQEITDKTPVGKYVKLDQVLQLLAEYTPSNPNTPTTKSAYSAKELYLFGR